MSDLEKIQKLWDDLCATDGDGAEWHEFPRMVRLVLGPIEIHWTKTTCTLNGVFILTTEPGVIPNFYHRKFNPNDPFGQLP